MIYLASEPVGDTYRALLKLAVRHSSEFRLVVGMNRHKPNAHAQKILDRLAPFLIAENLQTEWAGTSTQGPPVRVARYRVATEAVEVLSEADGLYSWMLPDLPEDLSFYVSDGRCFLGSTAHESEAMICVGDISAEAFEKAVPGAAYRWYAGSRQ